ncbi:GNAT family N-acetyltransferase [Flexibacterium corallicola]|uniref:GNAT family N-acetyltransferase n=1 Tax=Flexibacterium corallicola TaxID=3037259 RepID=UPI00286F4A24|nr:GNAT family N-acetyltransferase [Pseudovibrio sp. M1P-2-3]
MKIEFRQAELSDLDVVHAITKGAYAKWLPALGYAPYPTEEDHSLWIKKGQITLACEAGRTLGLIILELDKNPAYIVSIAVDPENIRKGVGRSLMAQAELSARLEGKVAIKLYTNLLMESNIHLYESLGYHECGRGEHPMRPGFTIVAMQKELT